MGSSQLVIGIDGGGTKTACLIADQSGTPLGHGLGGPTNPMFVGVPRARKSAKQALAVALREAGYANATFAAACCSGPHSEQIIAEVILRMVEVGAVLTVEEDEPVRFAATGGDHGVVVIAGTGSKAFARDRRGRKATAGGWGDRMGDEGSAGDIAIRAIRAAVRAVDGRAAPTALVDSVREHFRVDNLQELKPIFYPNGVPRHELVAFFEDVLAAAKSSDKVARHIFIQAGQELGLAALAVMRALDMLRQRVPVVLAGGVATAAGEWILRPMRHMILREAPHATVISTPCQPVVGDVLLALRTAGVAVTQRLRDRLIAAGGRGS